MAKEWLATIITEVAFTAKDEDEAEERLAKIEECVFDPKVKHPAWLGEIIPPDMSVQEN